MASAFVSKLAAGGARDPEALAAWIGRKKHGAAAMRMKAKSGAAKSKKGRSKPGATAQNLKPDSNGGFKDAGRISREEAARIMFGDRKAAALIAKSRRR